MSFVGFSGTHLRTNSGRKVYTLKPNLSSSDDYICWKFASNGYSSSNVSNNDSAEDIAVF